MASGQSYYQSDRGRGRAEAEIRPRLDYVSSRSNLMFGLVSSKSLIIDHNIRDDWPSEAEWPNEAKCTRTRRVRVHGAPCPYTRVHLPGYTPDLVLDSVSDSVSGVMGTGRCTEWALPPREGCLSPPRLGLRPRHAGLSWLTSSTRLRLVSNVIQYINQGYPYVW